MSVIVWHTIGYKGDVPELLNVPGRVSVWIFFGVSGYVIAHGFVWERYKLEPRSILQFYVNRALRICPLFFLITLIAVAHAGIEGKGPLIGIADIPAQVFAVQWNHNYVVNGVFWTLGIELQFYAIFPLCIFLLPIFGDGVRPVLIASAWICLWLIPAVVRLYAPDDLPSFLDSRNLLGNLQHFLAGALVASLSRAQVVARWSSRAGALCALAVGLAALVAATVLYHEHRSGFWFLKGSLAVDAAIVSLLLCHVFVERMQIPAGAIGNSVMAAGVIAYGLYAWHGFLMTAWPSVINSFLVTLGLSTLLALLSYSLVEEPALRLKNNWMKRGPQMLGADQLPSEVRETR